MSCFIPEIGLDLLLHMMHCGAAVCMKNIWGSVFWVCEVCFEYSQSIWDYLLGWL